MQQEAFLSKTIVSTMLSAALGGLHVHQPITPGKPEEQYW